MTVSRGQISRTRNAKLLDSGAPHNALSSLTTRRNRPVFARLAALRGWRADLTALGLGALAAAALPPVYAIPVLWVATPGLLALIDGAAGACTAARRGWWFGFGHNLLGLYWITEAILFEAARFWWLVPLAVPALAAVMAVFIAAPAALARLARARLAAGPDAGGRLGAGRPGAAVHRHGVSVEPWGSVWEIPGLAGDVMIQPAAWLGAPGLTFLTVLLSGLPSLGRALVDRERGRRWPGWAAVGFARLQAPLPPAPGLQVVLVQGNVPQGQKWDRAFVVQVFDRYLSLTRQGVAEPGQARRGGVAGDRQPVPAADRCRGARGDRRRGRGRRRPWSARCASTATIGRATACSPSCRMEPWPNA